MTIRTTKPAINLREELASLRNQGGYQEQQFYFDGLVTNGTFASDLSGWGTTTGWGYSSGKAQCDGVTAAPQLIQNIPIVAGKTYVIEVTVSNYSSGNCYVVLGSTQPANNNLTSNGTKVFTVTATSTNGLTFTTPAGTYSADLDNVSVYETDGTDVIHTMPKGWKPKDVFEDGLLQREGSGEDYTVIDNGFDYIIKPTVAPTASTQTTVIGVRK